MNVDAGQAPEASQQCIHEIESYALLRANNFGGLRALESLLASVPHDSHRKNDIARYEGYYARRFCADFSVLGAWM
ncbi:MAG: hypothetical protein OXN97_09940 [Bryobacterales bacterium]|nr:hypothetical protein [Bryobacterales bacterium]